MMMVQYLLDTDAEVAIPGVEAPVPAFDDVVAPVELALEQEKRVTEQINALLRIAREESDFASEQFMQWFIKEQVEEVATMSDLLAVVTPQPRRRRGHRGVRRPRAGWRPGRPDGAAHRRRLRIRPPTPTGGFALPGPFRTKIAQGGHLDDGGRSDRAVHVRERLAARHLLLDHRHVQQVGVDREQHERFGDVGVVPVANALPLVLARRVDEPLVDQAHPAGRRRVAPGRLRCRPVGRGRDVEDAHVRTAGARSRPCRAARHSRPPRRRSRGRWRARVPGA